MDTTPSDHAAAAGFASRIAGARDPARRTSSIDVLRGVAVLGMLAVHIQLFALPSVARWNPTAWDAFRGVDWWVWLVTQMFVDGKFIAIFAMLLGASIVMQARGDGGNARFGWSAHLRRMAALLVVGVAHAYLLWYGDMLVPLALCGALAFLARNVAPRRRFALGVAALAVGSLVPVVLTLHAMQVDPAAVAAWREAWVPRPDAIALELAQYRGGWHDQMAHRVPAALETQTWYFVTRLVWQMTGLMLLGMSLFQAGVLSATRSTAFYVVLVGAGFGAGLTLIGLGLHRTLSTGWDLLDYVLVSQPLAYWGNLLVALGFLALVMLLCRAGWPMRPVAAVGRVALTNYLLQTLVCTTIFYGHGFGLFGRVDRLGQLGIVASTWIVQLAGSMLWLRVFTVGPVEWLLRVVIHGRRLPFVRPERRAKQREGAATA